MSVHSDRPKLASTSRAAGISRILLWVMIGGYVAWFSYASFRNHDLFLTNGFDLGIFDYMVWNNLRGRIFSGTFIAEPSHLSIHFQLVLLPLSLVYLAWPDPKALLLAQAIVLGLGAAPVYWLAVERLNVWLGLIFTLVYLMFPAVQGASLDEFHPAPLAAGFLAFAYWYLQRGQYGRVWLFSLLAGLCQEDVWLLVGMLGLYWAVAWKDRRGLWLSGTGFGGFLLLSLVIIPEVFGRREVHIGLLRYQALGGSIPAILLTFITRPGFVWHYVFSDPDRVRYLTHLLAPVAYLSLFDPLTLLIIVPTAAMNLLSGLRTMYALDAFHYSAVLAPFVVMSAVNGAARLVNLLHTRRGYSTTFLYALFGAATLATTLTYQARFGYTPLNPAFQLPPVDSRVQTAYKMLSLIPPQAVVSAQSNLSPHLTQRGGAYLFPFLTSPEYGPAEYIALDLRGNIHPLQPEDYSARINDLLNSGEYTVIFSQDDFLLLQRQ